MRRAAEQPALNRDAPAPALGAVPREADQADSERDRKPYDQRQREQQTRYRDEQSYGERRDIPGRLREVNEPALLQKVDALNDEDEKPRRLGDDARLGERSEHEGERAPA